MCGILGIWTNELSFNLDIFNNLLDNLNHRGPDEKWSLKWKKMSIGFTRLKIMDIKKKFSEINSSSNDIIVLLNGEIWNFKNLAKEYGLNNNSSEYEVIRRLYLKYGKKYVSKLDGMFCIFILDKKKEIFYIFRDCVGIKPIFYYFDDKSQNFIFASDIKTICSCEYYEPRINENFLINRYIFGFSDFEDNLFEDIKQIPPSHFLQITIKNERLQISLERYQLDFLNSKSLSNNSYEYTQLNIIQKALKKRYFHTEQFPIGLMLSGGIDSSLLTFLAKFNGLDKIICFFLGDNRNPDSYWAKLISTKTNYQLLIIKLNISEIIKELPEICYKLSGYKGFASYFISKKVKEQYPEIKILLCGEGSDELYGGYEIYLSPREYFIELRNKIQLLKIKTRFIKKFEKFMENIKDNNNYLEKMLDYWLKEQLVNNHLITFDFGTMANSIETRVPFLDLFNIQFAKNLPEKKKISKLIRKIILKNILKELSNISDEQFYERPKNAMPHSLSSTFSKVRELIKYLIPLEWKKNHPYRKYFINDFDLFWFDLTYYLFIQNKCKIPRGFSIYNLYDNIKISK